MKIYPFLLLLLLPASFLFAQQNPFDICWLKDGHYSSDDYNHATNEIDTVGRSFLSIGTSPGNKKTYKVFDENGQFIMTDSLAFSAIAKSGNHYRWFSRTDSSTLTSDAVIEKRDAFNNVIWKDTLGTGDSINNKISLMMANEERLIVSGTTSGGILTEENAFISEYNETGTIMWYYTRGADNNLGDVPHALLVLSSGNILCEGISYGSGVNESDMWIASFTPQGILVNDTLIPTSYSDYASGLVESINGICYAMRTSNDDSDPYGNQFFDILKIDPSGSVIGSCGYFYGQNIDFVKNDSQGNLYVLSTEDYYGEPVSISISKFDADFNPLWKVFPAGYDAWGLVLDSNENLYCLTKNFADGFNLYKATIYKYLPDGTLEWTVDKEAGGNNSFYPQTLNLKENNQLLLLGLDGAPFNSSLSLLSIDLGGNILWDDTLENVPTPYNARLSKLNDYTYYITGDYASADANHVSDYFCLKLCDDIALGSANAPAILTISIFPNPSEGIFTIQLPNGFNTQDLKIEVMDAHGKIVMSSNVSDHYPITFQINPGLSNGLYLVKILSHDTMLQTPVILQR